MQRIFLWLCLGSFLVLAGCTTEGDKIYNTYNYPGDSTGMVKVISPGSRDTLKALYDWIPNPYPNNNTCGWGYSLDTTFQASVICYVPGQVQDVQVYFRSSSHGSFQPSGEVLHPASDTFQVPIWDTHQGFSYQCNAPAAYEAAFYVQVMTVDSSNYMSRTVPFVLAYGTRDQSHTPPLAPVLDTVAEYSYGNMAVQWCGSSPQVSHYIIGYQSQFDAQPRMDTVSVSSWYMTLQRYLPAANYSVWMKAINDYGVSPASNTMQVSTQSPAMPINLETWLHPDRVVELRWQYYSNNTTCESLYVARRDTSSGFATIKAVARDQYNYIPSGYLDSTAVAHSIYYYKLGLNFRSGTWWTEDSVGVWVP